MIERIGEEWTIFYFSTPNFNEEVLNGVLCYMDSIHILGEEVFLLLDDLMIRSIGDISNTTFLVQTFATIRHHNISIIATIQSDSPTLLDVLRNSTFIYVMQSFGIVQTLSKILRTFIGLINSPSIIRRIYPLLEESQVGSYVLVNVSHLADRNNQFTISNQICATEGFTKHYLNKLSVENEELKNENTHLS